MNGMVCTKCGESWLGNDHTCNTKQLEYLKTLITEHNRKCQAQSVRGWRIDVKWPPEGQT